MRIIITISILLATTQLWAQPTNDDCLSAINISSIDNYCSEPMEFTNEGAAADPITQQAIDQCVSINFQTGVWFSFIPTEPAVLIEVNSIVPLGTIANIRGVLYTGNCNTGLDYVSCTPGGTTFLEFTVTELTLGQRYYFYVESDPMFTGSFQLCINDFIAPPSPESDCPDAVVLCNKDPFGVESLNTAGNDATELNGFVGTCVNEEFASAWYKWTCDDPGDLTFTLTPNDWRLGVESDDIDFALFELPNGLDDCANKQMLRCMASGETGGCPLDTWIVCNGPTGLGAGSTDVEEFPGCSTCTGGTDDNFIAPIIMESGKSYALVIMNFTRSGKGFSIEFGGSGTFLGPSAAIDFEVTGDFLECDKEVTFTDNSRPSADPIVNRFWNFGVGAVPPTGTGQSPPPTTYLSFGPKSVALTLESSRGCLVTEIIDVFVEPCCEDFPDIEIVYTKKDVLCAGEESGEFMLTGIEGTPEYSFSVNGGEYLPNTTYNNLPPGDYFVDIIDIKGCENGTIITITEPDPLFVDAGSNIEIDLGYQDTLNATIMTSGQPVTYMWTPEEGLDCPFSDLIDCPDPIVVSPGTTTYTVIITDENGCTATDQVVVTTNIIRPYYAPTAITPNTQDIESEFKLGFGRQAERVLQFYIYDRWGNQIYVGTDIEIDGNNEMVSGWDGRFGRQGQVSSNEVNPGVYVWFANVLFIDGVSLALAGDITVIK